MRLRRKKGDEEEVVSGEVVPEMTTQDDTVDMEAVAPATPAGGASRPDDHGERTGDDSTTVLEQATGEGGHAGTSAPPGVASGPTAAGEEAAGAQREADERARAEAERERADRAAAAPSTTVSGASITSPGLGGDASPRAAAAANASEPERPAAASAPAPAAGSGEAGPLAPILEHPAVQKKPELLVAGGLAAGFVFAKLLKAITSPDA